MGANSNTQPQRSRPTVLNRLSYNILFTLILPLIIVRLLWRSLKAPAYARRWAERFGLATLDTPQRSQKGRWLWIHAVSVGESIAAAPLIRKLRAEHPELPIVVTTMTPTGSERVREMFGSDICHVTNFLRRFRPHTLVVMETELWPNIIHYTKTAGGRVIVANARLSEKSARGYEKFPKLGKPMLRQIDCIAAQAENDARRFRRLGVAQEQLQITGSIKFEIDVPENLAENRAVLARLIEGKRSILIAASTREGEEEKVLFAYKACLREIPNLLLVLVPRHPERFRAVAKLVQECGLTLVKRSENTAVSELCNVFLGDSMGEMLQYFSISDIAFVGGSLVPTGCHNVLEPAALGLPVLVGPSQFNFQTICEQLEEAGALQSVPNEQALATALLLLFADVDLQKRMGEAGRTVLQQNRGALQRSYEIVWHYCESGLAQEARK